MAQVFWVLLMETIRLPVPRVIFTPTPSRSRIDTSAPAESKLQTAPSGKERVDCRPLISVSRQPAYSGSLHCIQLPIPGTKVEWRVFGGDGGGVGGRTG